MKGPAGYSRLLLDLFPLVSVVRLGTAVEWKLKNAVENDLFSSSPTVDQIFSIRENYETEQYHHQDNSRRHNQS